MKLVYFERFHGHVQDAKNLHEIFQNKLNSFLDFLKTMFLLNLLLVSYIGLLGIL